MQRGRERAMQPSRGSKNRTNDLEERFGIIERRVKALVAENKNLKARVAQLERELDQAKREARDLAHLEGTKTHIREKIENILSQLEAVGLKK
jgi:multidrug resistance efflux pump